MSNDPNPAVQGARDGLLDSADVRSAFHMANQAGDVINDLFNAAGVSASTSLVARALTARAIIHVAATWFNDLAPTIALETTLAAIESITSDPPPELRAKIILDPDLLEEATRKMN